MSVIAIVLQLLELGLPILETIQAAAIQEMQLSGSTEPPTAAEQATLDAGLEAAHAALQAARQGDAMANSPSTGGGV